MSRRQQTPSERALNLAQNVQQQTGNLSTLIEQAVKALDERNRLQEEIERLQEELKERTKNANNFDRLTDNLQRLFRTISNELQGDDNTTVQDFLTSFNREASYTEKVNLIYELLAKGLRKNNGELSGNLEQITNRITGFLRKQGIQVNDGDDLLNILFQMALQCSQRNHVREIQNLTEQNAQLRGFNQKAQQRIKELTEKLEELQPQLKDAEGRLGQRLVELQRKLERAGETFQEISGALETAQGTLEDGRVQLRKALNTQQGGDRKKKRHHHKKKRR